MVKDYLIIRDASVLSLPQAKAFRRLLDTSDTSWLSKEEVDYYTTKFDKKGFTGGLNYYQNFYQNLELIAPSPWTGAQVKVPVKFIVGDQYLFTNNFLDDKDYIEKGGYKKDVPFLQEVVVIDGAAHFLNQEKPDDINKHISDFFEKF